MNKVLIIFPFFIFLISAAPSLLTGKIIGISDGDTVTLLTAGKIQYKIRLQGVDCPEKNQAFGQKAKQFVSDMVFNKNVSVQVFGTDKYGRTIGEVFLPGKVSLNKELVRAGYAWHYKQYSDDTTLARLEIEARNEKRGLWADPDPVAPWNFCHGKKAAQSKKTSSTSSSHQKRNISSPSPTSDNTTSKNMVSFNVSSHKVHCMSCSAAARCTKNCVTNPYSTFFYS